MSGHPVAEPYEPPAADQPSRAERQALQALTERVRPLLAAAFGSAEVNYTLLQEPGPEWAPRPPDEGGWAIGAAWVHGGAWRLLLAPEAAAALLAAQLGQDELADHAFTDLDLRLLQLPMRSLAGELARALGVGGNAPELVLARGPAPVGVEPAVLWRVRLEHRGRAGEVLLAASWPELRAALAPPASQRRLDPRLLDGAPVGVEAFLAAPTLTARELLDMQPGDVLTLGAGDQESILTAHGLPFARGRMGAKGGRLAISIQHIEPPKEE